MTRICIVGPSKKFLSGISYYTIRLANTLCKSHAVSAICFRNLLPQKLFPGRERIGKQISDVDFDTTVAVFERLDYNSPRSWLEAYRFLKKHSPDVIILQWWTSSVAHMHLIIKILNNLHHTAKIVLEMHEVIDPLEDSILPIRLYSRVVGKLLKMNLSAYITHSESDKKLVATTYNINTDKIYVIPLGLYNHHGTPIDKNIARIKLGIQEKFVILSFGLIRKYKGVPHLINAFDKLPREIANKSRLLIVGEIWDKDLNIEQKITNSQYKNQITFVPEYISDKMVRTYFSACDVVVLPYLRASQSAIANIAVTFGKPVIVSDVGGLKESMKDYAGTIFVPPADSTAIKDAIIKIYNQDRDVRYAPPKRGWDEIAKMYEKVIEEII